MNLHPYLAATFFFTLGYITRLYIDNTSIKETNEIGINTEKSELVEENNINDFNENVFDKPKIYNRKPRSRFLNLLDRWEKIEKN